MVPKSRLYGLTPPRRPLFLLKARPGGLFPRGIPGGLLVGGGQPRGEGGRLHGQGRVGEVLLPAPGQARQEVRLLPRGRVLGQVDAEDRALRPRRPAEAVQEEQQEGQEQHDGGRQQDAQEGLHVVFAGADLLGALRGGNAAQLGDGHRRSPPPLPFIPHPDRDSLTLEITRSFTYAHELEPTWNEAN